MEEAQTPKDRRDAGRKLRKAQPRAALAHWNAEARRRTVGDLLEEASKDCLPHLLALKRERMASSAFGFFRGAAPVMAYDLSLKPHTGLLAQLCGDAHVQNLGAFASPGGTLTFDINDFDETTRGPFEWDLKRLATSLLLAASAANISAKAGKRAVETFLAAYTSLMHRLAEMPVLQAVRYQVHHLETVAPIARLFEQAARATPQVSQERLLEKAKQGLRFRTELPLLRRTTGAEAKGVLAALPAYVLSLPVERRAFLAQCAPLDVAFKVVGTGSVGLRDYCVYLEGNGPHDPLFLQIKQAVDSRYAPYLPAPATPALHNGQRVVEGQRAMQVQSDPLLGWTTIEGRDYLVRQLNDHKAALDVTTLNASGLLHYAQVCGEMFARGHARSGSAGHLAGYLGKGLRFAEAIHKFAHAYAAQSTADWKQFRH
jgi:uncharacterized protein (DUF2252 family)